MFKFIFYFFGVIALLYEWWAMYNHDKIKALNEKVKKTPKAEIKAALTDTEKAFTGLQFLYMLWMFVGLFGSQWVIFLFIFFLSILNQWFKADKTWNAIDSVLTMTAIVFAILNTYHLHINVVHKLLTFFQD